jgi:hypothetical protein
VEIFSKKPPSGKFLFCRNIQPFLYWPAVLAVQPAIGVAQVNDETEVVKPIVARIHLIPDRLTGQVFSYMSGF